MCLSLMYSHWARLCFHESLWILQIVALIFFLVFRCFLLLPFISRKWPTWKCLGLDSATVTLFASPSSCSHSPLYRYLLKGVAGISSLELWRNRYSFVVHFPVKSSSHGIPRLRLVAKVIVVNDIDHRTHDGFVVKCNLVWKMKVENRKWHV